MTNNNHHTHRSKADADRYARAARLSDEDLAEQYAAALAAYREHRGTTMEVIPKRNLNALDFETWSRSRRRRTAWNAR